MKLSNSYLAKINIPLVPLLMSFTLLDLLMIELHPSLDSVTIHQKLSMFLLLASTPLQPYKTFIDQLFKNQNVKN
jgi:hypothetical protein